MKNEEGKEKKQNGGGWNGVECEKEKKERDKRELALLLKTGSSPHFLFQSLSLK